jgi:hypothetical protein
VCGRSTSQAKKPNGPVRRVKSGGPRVESQMVEPHQLAHLVMVQLVECSWLTAES